MVDTADGCEPLDGAAVYVWHCDKEGHYSMYAQGVDRPELPARRTGDRRRRARQFTSIFPACYSGRWPHVHFEVYPSLASITELATKLATSQLALPRGRLRRRLRDPRTTRRASATMSQVSLTSDMVFSDGVGLQTPTMTGSASDGVVASLVIPV